MSDTKTPFPKMTAKEFRSVVSDYASALPGWKKTSQNWIVREEFPVCQTIWFQRLRSGGYRPTNSLKSIPFNASCVIHQILDVKHQSATFRQHPSRWQAMSAAMKTQFKPRPDAPLELAELLRLCRSERVSLYDPHPSYLLFEAVVAAWLDQLSDAKVACDYAITYVDPFDRAEPDWLKTIRAQASDLRDSIERNQHREFLVQSAETT